MSTPRQRWMLLAFLGACYLVAFFGSLATTSSVGTWYAALERPSWAPPNWLFAPVWTALYAMMAVAAWRVWVRAGWGHEMGLFGAQLTLNLAWSMLFFGGRSPIAGLVDIVALWLLIAATLQAFWRRSVLAGWLMVPYLVWVSFAASLNYAIWRLNR